MRASGWIIYFWILVLRQTSLVADDASELSDLADREGKASQFVSFSIRDKGASSLSSTVSHNLSRRSTPIDNSRVRFLVPTIPKTTTLVDIKEDSRLSTLLFNKITTRNKSVTMSGMSAKKNPIISSTSQDSKGNRRLQSTSWVSRIASVCVLDKHIRNLSLSAWNNLAGRSKPIDMTGLGKGGRFLVPGITTMALDYQEDSRLSTMSFQRHPSRSQSFKLARMSVTKDSTIFSTPKNSEGNRRLQSTPCDSELSVYASCVPSDACAQCLGSQLEQALELEEGATCGDLEMGLCAIAPFCNCGCENEAEAYYGCIVDNVTEGQCSIDCGSTEPDCDVQVSAANTCLSPVNPSCPQCTLDTIEALFGGGETISCTAFESETCSAIYNSCECGSCANEVEVMFDCLLSESECGGLQCDAQQPPPPPPTNPPVVPPVKKTIAPATSPTTTKPIDTFTFSPTSAPQEEIVGEDIPSPASKAIRAGQLACRVTVLGLVVSAVIVL